MATKKTAIATIAAANVNESQALAKVREIEDDLAIVLEAISEEPLTCTDDADYQAAAEQLITVVLKRDYVNEQLGLFMADAKKLVERVNGWFAKARNDAGEAEAYFRNALREYAVALDDQAHELRVLASKTKDSEKSDELFAKANALHPPKVPGISLSGKVRVEVLDESKVPEKFWRRVVDLDALALEADANRKVPGVKFTNDKTVRVTPKHAQAAALKAAQ